MFKHICVYNTKKINIKNYLIIKYLIKYFVILLFQQILIFFMTDKEEKIKYSQVVSSIVEDKKYFEDAMDWYCLKYLSIISEKTYFIVLSVFSFLIVLFLYFTINNILPLKETLPVLIKTDKTVDYFAKINPIKPTSQNYSSNEAILRFLLLNYARELFNHDYRSGNINDLNKKLLKVKNYSSDEVFEKFKDEFNVISANMFNKRVIQTVSINTFRFIKNKPKDVKSKISNYVFSTLPTEAEITYTLYVNNGVEIKKTNGKIMLSFKFEPIRYNSIKKEFTMPTLVVTNYAKEENNV